MNPNAVQSGAPRQPGEIAKISNETNRLQTRILTLNEVLINLALRMGVPPPPCEPAGGNKAALSTVPCGDVPSAASAIDGCHFALDDCEKNLERLRGFL